jgi:uncharacterized repeat protein (TIGR01451 family)
MTQFIKFGKIGRTAATHPPTRSRTARQSRQPSSARCRLRLEQLEQRITPSLLGTFELDANATTGTLGSSGSTTTSHDWDQVNNPGQFGSSGALATAFVTDKVSSNTDDIFQGGGSKDTEGIQAGRWLFTAGKPQGKDDITHAYAAAYTDPGNGHLLLYAGLDRFDNSGDSTAGFWFFANNIAENPNVTTNGGHPFTGTHQDGDILLVSDFTVGGSVSTIKVFRWTGNDSTGSLVALNNGNPISGNTFAIVNSSSVGVPWLYTNKSGANQPAAGEFLEEGVDLTALGLQGCFSTFLAETRSSQSPTATLSDFVTGSFPLCSLTAPQFTGLSKFDTFTHQGDLVTYPLTVTNSGGMPLYIQSVTDTLLGNIVLNHTVQAAVAPVVSITPSNSAYFGVNAIPLPVGQTVILNVTRPVQAGDPDPTSNTTTFIGTDDLAGNDDPITTTVTDSVNLFQPSVSMTEAASPTAGVAATPITYTYTVTNTSSSDSPNLVLDTSNSNSSFTSSLFGNIEADAIHALAGNNTATTASLAPGASFSFTETRQLAATDPTPLTDSATAVFTLSQDLGAFPNLIHSNTTTATVRRVNAEISIAPNGVNEVNHSHTFTVTVLEDLGDGNGFVAAGSVPVTVTLTNTNGSTTSPLTYNVTTDNAGHASVTFTSATAGEVIGNASTTFSVGGVTLTRATGDSNAGDSGPATKFFEDAQISIAPNATNGLTELHTFTVTVLANAGDGSGYVPAVNAPVTVTLTGQNGAVPIPESPLSGNTNASGQFQVSFTSDSAGQVLGNASTTFTLNGLTLTRATGDGLGEVGFVDSGPATKTFVAGSLRWKKVDGNGNLLGGATFLVTATGGTAAGLSPTTVSVLDNGPFDADPTAGQFLLNAYQAFGGSNLTGLALGTYTVQETTPPSGYTLDPKVLSATLTLAAPNADLSSTPFVDTLPQLAITKAVSVGSPTVVHPGDTASYTITVTNTGSGTALNVVVTDVLPDASQLAWTATSPSFTTSISGGVLTSTDASLAGGASATITVSAVIPTNFFGTPPNSSSTDSVPLGLFELDGNATTGTLGTSGSTTTSHDWDQVFADAGSPSTSGSFDQIGPLSGARAGSFVKDAVNSNQDDIFQGGGSKDTNGIQEGAWLFTGGKPQGKDDIEHAFAALYIDPTTKDTILYAGLDRFDNSGDSTAGFWFFTNPIGQNANVTTNGGHPFTGTHTTGDILLVSDFTQGGSVSTIKVFEWVGDDVTGSLVALNSGNPIDGKTFAIVNGSNVTLPWTFNNKSKTGGNVALPGEFLEEGVNLTSLGLNACFSTFLAETRSSQSPTATLSDFVLGTFDTCDVQLPNSASVQASNFNNGKPITSNSVTIDVNDGHALVASSVGSGAGVVGLTTPQLQSAVAQAIAAWTAAGIDAGTLSNLDNVTFHIGDLPGAELGFELPGQIWIDQTAAGWGWSVGDSAAPGRMDLVSVVSHEVGHALGFDHADSGVMEAALAPGVRLVPEALSSPSSGPAAVSPAAEAGPAPHHASQPALFNAEIAEAAFVATGVASPTAIAVVDGLVSQASAPVLLTQPVQSVLGAVATPLPLVVAGDNWDLAVEAVPGQRPPNPRQDYNHRAVGEVQRESEQAAPVVPENTPADGLSWQGAGDACFTGEALKTEWEDLAPTLSEGAAQGMDIPAVAALGLALAGWWGIRPTQAETRRRQRTLSESV